MNKVASRYEDLKALLKRGEGFVDTFQFLLSAVAVAMVLADFFVPSGFTVPYLGARWSDCAVWVRGFTWVVFIIDFVAFGLASGEPFKYAKTHVLELLVCLTWVPYYNPDLFKHVPGFLTVDMLTLIGSVVHINMIGRWMVRRFREHPEVVVLSLTGVLLGTATPILMKVEPQTFPNFSDTLWFCSQTIFTVGYGDIVPHTDAGRVVAGLLIINGVGIGGMFIALTTRYMQKRANFTDPVTKLEEKVDAQQKLLEELLVEVRKRNACGCDKCSHTPNVPERGPNHE